MEPGRQPPVVAHNRKVVLRGYIDRVPREDDLELVDGGAVALRVPEGAAGPAVLVKNLYLSCDPYMRGRMRDFHGSYIPPFKPGSVGAPLPQILSPLCSTISPSLCVRLVCAEWIHALAVIKRFRVL
jgi:hypothetical protein